MKPAVVRWLIAVAAILALPVVGFAQEAVITGTVADTIGDVPRGVAVTAVHEATGNTCVTVTERVVPGSEQQYSTTFGHESS